jgi:glycosyltransferase involved in cell wall biosynthesis
MRLCVVSGTFHPEPGGPSTFLYHLLPALQAKGYEIRVVAYGEPTAPEAYPYPVNRISRRQPIPLRLLAMARAILKAGQWADAFFVSDYGLPVAAANLFLHKPILLKNVGDFAWEFSTRHSWIPVGQTIDRFQTAPHSIRVNFLRRVQRWYTQAASKVIAPSHYSASLVLGWGIDPAKVQVIYNALDPLPDLPSHEMARAQLGLNGPLVVTVARLTPWKGVAGLIRVVNKLRTALPQLKLIVVGDGPERAALEREAAPFGEAVTFTGAQPPEQVGVYLRAADVFALFSTYEGLPHTVLEAMQVGTPVVVSDAGGNREVVTQGETGWMVKTGDENALAAALREALQDRTLAARQAEAALAGLDRFSWARLVEGYQSALRALR